MSRVKLQETPPAGTISSVTLQKNPPGADDRHYAAEDYLFREGDASQTFFLIKTGTVSVRKTKGHGYVEIAKVYQGEVLGELGFFDREPRNASAMAITPVEAIEIQYESLTKVYSTIPPYLKAIVLSIVGRLRKADETIRRLEDR